MKPQFLKVPLATECSFSVRQDTVPHFYNQWHYHPEIELVHIEKGTGTQFVGDSIQNFQAGDVLLIGSNLPHYWRCDGAYFDGQEENYAQATVVHFLDTFWGDKFLLLPENRLIAQFLEKARQGIRLHGRAREETKQFLKQMLTEKGTAQIGTHRIITLMQILLLLAESTEIELLSAVDYPSHFDDADTDRINQIYAYSIANFRRKIPLHEIAAVAHMSPNFKARSLKSYSHFILELRVQYACKLLMDGRLSIAQICYESGFNQFSGFNKYFKLITGKSPMHYQKTFSKAG